MCNLYAMTKNKDAIRTLFDAMRVHYNADNLPSLPAIFPGTLAPIIRNGDGGRELIMARWGMPNVPPHPGWQTNIRTTSLKHWRQWIDPTSVVKKEEAPLPANHYRCLVPLTSFAEYSVDPDPKTKKKDAIWFAPSKERPLFAFAGLWCNFTGNVGSKKTPNEGTHLLYAFLTCAANAVVKPIHAQAMPVILHQDDWNTWMTAGGSDALKLQKPWPNDQLEIVARAQDKEDKAA
jgi:putative SOS response-associated peptidase YedK